jgi:putative endonuclease
MRSNLTLGQYGEALAIEWLNRQHFTVLERNWRHSRYEIDIIAVQKNIIHCIEVKTRRTNTYGWPEEYITHRKIVQMQAAAEHFLWLNEQFHQVQLDVLSVLFMKNHVEFRMMEVM